MSDDSNLGPAVQAAIKAVTKGNIISDGVIVAGSVDEGKFICDVSVSDSSGSCTYHNVPLRVLIGSQASIVEIPEDGTNCIICFRDGNLGRPQILAIDRALKILVNCPQFVFNDGKFGGLVKVEDLVTQLNTIQKDINNLKQVLSSWTPVPNDGGAALKTAVSVWAGSILTETVRDDIENKDITQ